MNRLWALRLAVLSWLLGSATALAQVTADPLKSPACGEATQALEAARQTAGPGAQAAARIEELRRHAARVCLGAGAGREGAKPPARVARQPERVPAPTIAVSRPVPSASPPVVAPPPSAAVQNARPQALTQCDAGGCWDANGTRLNRAGPNLIGPNGPCSVQGNFANCP